MMTFMQHSANIIKKIIITVLMAILFPVMIIAAIVAVFVENIQESAHERSKHKAVIANQPVIADNLIQFPGYHEDTDTHRAIS